MKKDPADRILKGAEGLNQIICCDFFNGFRMSVAPLSVAQTGIGNGLTDLNNQFRNSFLQHAAQFLTHLFLTLFVIASDIKQEGRIWFLVDDFQEAAEAQVTHLMGAAGAGAAGNVNLGQSIVWQIGSFDCGHDILQQTLRIPQTYLADGVSNAADGSFKFVSGVIILQQISDLQSFLAGQVDDPCCFIGRKTQFHIFHVSQQLCQSVKNLQIGRTALGMPFNGIEAFLFLLSDLEGLFHFGLVAFFGGFHHFQIFRVQTQIFLVHDFLEFSLEGIAEGFFGTKSFHHVAGSGFGSVVIVAVFTESVNLATM